ncbi:MAG TPA: SRPBCC domain-containing protein [Rhizomicrobium sp.]|nr:SRPBCC domain-containing protein [Rhizomicrobium sp.]
MKIPAGNSIFAFLAAAVAVVSPIPVSAAVEDEAANGFTVSETADIAAAPARVYEALLAPAHWWNSAHTYSHDAANLTFDARAGGCWCEELPGGGSVQHMVVVNAIPGKLLRLRGALGPLQGMAVDGAMTVGLRAAGNHTQLTLTYAVGGYAKPGFEELSKAVDSVLGEQTARLARFIETGSAESAAQTAGKGE